MTDYQSIEQRFTEALSLRRRPVAVKFQDKPPAGLAKFSGREPSGCSFWRLAAEGRSFYTVPSDHYNCPIGSYTHNISLPPERAQELEQTLSFMAGIGYIKMEEVAGIPRLPETPGVVIYAPLANTPVDPDAVIFAGQPRSIMLVQEAAVRAGAMTQAALFGRPTCMSLPAAMDNGFFFFYVCLWNVFYTDLSNDELYVVVPGKDLARIADEVETIAAANAKLFEYHRGRRQDLATE